jgi:phosphopantothenoylcysteine decarboxylase/phosphopantothenate--cysteine ligase
MSLDGKTVVLCVTGSIAAYKAVEVARRLKKAGARVLPVVTKSGARFVGEVTFSGITGERVYSDMWDPSFKGEMHVTLADEADVVCIVPATADVLARMAHGRADDLVTAIYLCARGRVICAPAMHPRMWEHPATAANVKALLESGRVDFVGPVDGEVASGDRGMGRMAEPEAIVAAIARAAGPRDLENKHVVVTAGPTHEAWDPVRFLGNRSSGKMGFSIAERAALRGARVTLVAGPVSLATPAGVTRVDVVSAKDMQDAVDRAIGRDLSKADALVMAAAVADFRPQVSFSQKIKKTKSMAAVADAAPGDTIPQTNAPFVPLAENPDILATIGAARTKAKRNSPVLVGFALETGSDDDIIAYATKKRGEKGVDFVVANRAEESLGTDATRVFVVRHESVESFPAMQKSRIAEIVLDEVVKILNR